MAVEDPCNAFTCDPRFKEIERQIDDMRIGDVKYHSLYDMWQDGPEDFVDWLQEDEYESRYDSLTTILGVMMQYIDSREYEDHEFEQEDIDELLTYAENTQIKAFFPER